LDEKDGEKTSSEHKQSKKKERERLESARNNIRVIGTKNKKKVNKQIIPLTQNILRAIRGRGRTALLNGKVQAIIHPQGVA
jgi:hypothetical protein